MFSSRFDFRRLFFPLSLLAYWLALPPAGWWIAAFFTPALWCVLVRLPELPGKRPYRDLYVTTVFFWIITLYWVSFPHWATSVGLAAMAVYLGAYMPLLIAVARTAFARLRCPPFLVLPVVWCGLEFLRKYFFGGFSLASLEHALYQRPELIRIGDLGGEYLVGMLIVLVGAAFGSLVPLPSRLEKPDEKTTGGAGHAKKYSYDYRPLAVALPLLFLAWFYGTHSKISLPRETGTFRIAVLQINDPVWLGMPEKQLWATHERLLGLSLEAAKQEPDLIVWPESTCPVPLIEIDPGFITKEGSGTTTEELRERAAFIDEQLLRMTRHIGKPVLYGIGSYHFLPEHGEEPQRLNSALLIDPGKTAGNPNGSIDFRYDKVHLVMFGEYVPFARRLPRDFPLRTLCQEAARGKGPVAMTVPATPSAANRPDAVILPNICFESCVAPLIRKQVATARREGNEPRFLVNLSNDGWFRFTSQADLHLATHVFRAVENRLPYASSTNGGFGVVIGADGRILARGRRGEAEVVHAEIPLPPTSWKPEPTLYARIGDMPAWTCLLLTLLLGLAGGILHRRGLAKRSEV